MKTKLTAFLLTGIAGSVLAQTPAPDANTLMNMGRFDEAKALLTRTAQQSRWRRGQRIGTGGTYAIDKQCVGIAGIQIIL